MPKQKKICRVCGAQYEACRSVRAGNNVFNWREVACSPECGAAYFKRVMDARKKDHPEADDSTHRKPVQRRKDRANNKEGSAAETEVSVSNQDISYNAEYAELPGEE